MVIQSNALPLLQLRIVFFHYRAYLGMARHQLRNMLTERKGTEGKSGVAEALKEGKKFTLFDIRWDNLI